MNDEWLVLIESNTTGSGRLFCAGARELGLRPVLFARDPGRYPYVAADRVHSRVVDTTAPDAVREACAALSGRIAGVASSSEYFIAIASEVARTLHLPHPDPMAVRACRDKFTQRSRVRGAGVPCPAFSAAGTPEEAVAAAARIGLPVVVKPVAGSGSIGVRLCSNLDEVRAAAGYVLGTDPAKLALPPQAAVVVEEYLIGEEYSVETIDEHVVGVTHKHLGPLPYFVEVGHDFPAPLNAGEQAAMEEQAVTALRALGLGWGAAHIELRRTPVGPRVIEVNPRLAGGMIPRMVQEACGIDMILHVVAKAAGRGEIPRPSHDRAASIRFLVAEQAGRLVGIDGVDRARAVPGVVEVGLTVHAGQDVVLRHSFQDRLAYVIAATAHGPAAARAAEDGLRALHARIAAPQLANPATSSR